MGVSSDGLLLFGFSVGDDDKPPDWLFDPEDEDADALEFDDFVCGISDLPADAPYEARKAFIDACPAELVLYCSYDYPMYVLTVRGTTKRAYRGDLNEVGDLTVEPERIAAFKAWCETNDIPYEEPKWFLASMYA